MTRSEFLMRFGRWFKYQRLKRDWMRTDVASRLNCQLASIIVWETGNDLPDAYYLYLILSMYGVPKFMNLSINPDNC